MSYGKNKVLASLRRSIKLLEDVEQSPFLHGSVASSRATSDIEVLTWLVEHVNKQIEMSMIIV